VRHHGLRQAPAAPHRRDQTTVLYEITGMTAIQSDPVQIIKAEAEHQHHRVMSSRNGENLDVTAKWPRSAPQKVKRETRADSHAA